MALALASPARLMMVLLLATSLGSLVPASATPYWNANYDSLARVLNRQPAGSERVRLLRQLVDLRPTATTALPYLDELVQPSPGLRAPERAAYRTLRAGVQQWHRWPQPGAAAASLDSLQQAIKQFELLKHPVPRLLIDLPIAFNRLNRHKARYHYFRNQLAYYQLTHQPYSQAACYMALGTYFWRLGDQHQAINHYLRAADLLRSFDHHYYVNELMVIGAAYADWGNPTKALHYLHLAMQQPGFGRSQSIRQFYTYQAIARLYLQQNDLTAAHRYAQLALQARIDDAQDQQSGRAHALVLQSAIWLAQGQPTTARPLLLRAQHLADSLRLPVSGRLGELELPATWARYYEQLGQTAQAERSWRRAYQQATAAQLHGLRARYLRELSRFYASHQQFPRAWQYTQQYFQYADSTAAAQGQFRVAQYENERKEQAKNAQIATLLTERRLQELRLQERSRLLWGALVAFAVTLALGLLLSRQLRLHRRTLAELRRTQNQLVQSEKWAFVGEVSAGIAHELQNPLNFMKRFAEVSTKLVDTVQTAGPAGTAGLEQEILSGLRQNLAEISQHGLRASAIIRDMLDHSRAGSTPRTPSNLNALVAHYTALATPEASAAPAVTLEVVLDPPLDTLLLPLIPDDLGRVLLNLLGNACYAAREQQRTSPDPTYQPQVRISTAAHPDGAEIRVFDNGAGIPAEVRQRIFQPFFTTKPLGEGTGLGLSISADIVQRGHGGTIAVQSEPGRYTEFIIVLPRGA